MASTSDTKSQKGSLLTNGHLCDLGQNHNDDFGEVQATKDTVGSTRNGVESLEKGISSSRNELSLLYSPAIEAKIWAVASKALAMVSIGNTYHMTINTDVRLQTEPPSLFPEYTRANGKGYVYRDLEFWTSGFFPGTMYQLLYRSRVFPAQPNVETAKTPHLLKLEWDFSFSK